MTLVKLRIAYNGQSDALLTDLTVEEALKYASELKTKQSKRYDFFDENHEHYRMSQHNGTRHTGAKQLDPIKQPLTSAKHPSHTVNVRNMLEVFGLMGCRRVTTGAISGGQKKRLSIALELIFSPNVLLLDEPTTGLDSVSSYQCLSLLKTLSYNREPLVIAASIHQPTARLLAFFDHIYVLSVDGRCVYSGPTDRLIAHLSSFGFHCPLIVYHNPADYVIEISSGGHGSQAIDSLAEYESERLTEKLDKMQMCGHESIGGRVLGKNLGQHCERKRTAGEQWRDLWILVKRAHRVSVRNPLVVWLRVLALAISLATKFMVYSQARAGKSSDGGCADIDSVFAKMRSVVVKENTMQRTFKNIQNVSYILSTTMFIHFVTIAPTLMTFPLELNTFMKEHFNKWYTTWSYFMARSVVDVPVVVGIPMVYATIMWWMTNQEWDVWRFSLMMLVMVMVALVSHSMGLLLSSFFINNIRASLLSFTIFIAPFLLFSGALIPIRTMPSYLQTFSYLSIFSLNSGMLIILYGFNRCPSGVLPPITMDRFGAEFGLNMNQLNECLSESDSLTNVTHNTLRSVNRMIAAENPSKMLEWFALKDSDLWISNYSIAKKCKLVWMRGSNI
ncbi:unnamed protein product [Medioppia subpectinata]|uniref:ABC transporter domain-containing protein n=1 Tax=Medioppia subpectinata TaxID=1979941 RepID=A0A7R9KLS4_9ACAR|nr:unnamed protein product [Medioppia subpectinata]CAG2104720.1 unnamed protein product [Medioppia subpectinata]